MRGLLLTLLLAVSGSAQAHRLNIFAMSDGGQISGYVYFPGGKRAAELPVVLMRDGQTLAEQSSDAEGQFSFPLPPEGGALLVSAQSADGHAAHFSLDLEGETPAAPTPSVSDTTCSTHLDAKALEHAIAAQVRPLREQLDALAQQRRWQDVIGGLGYIAGLFGLAMFYFGRRR